MLVIFSWNEEDQYACRVQARQLSLSSLCSYLPWSRNLVQAITPILFELNWYLVGMKKRTSRHVTCKRDNCHFICYVVISPEAEIVLKLVHSITSVPLRHILIMFDRNEEEDQQACHIQERQLSLSLLSSYLPLSRNLMQAVTPILFEIMW